MGCIMTAQLGKKLVLLLTQSILKPLMRTPSSQLLRNRIQLIALHILPLSLYVEMHDLFMLISINRRNFDLEK